jgi:signal transduction histidine kinase
VVQNLAEDLPEIDAYPGELNQVWTSLIDNAIDAMAGQGTLEVTAITEGDHVVVTVSDTGAGMAPDVLEHAFDIFFTTKAVGMGTGLGLALARRVVVERHSGDIKIDSSSAGTRVRVFLPTPARISDPAALPDGPSRSGHDDE